MGTIIARNRIEALCDDETDRMLLAFAETARETERIVPGDGREARRGFSYAVPVPRRSSPTRNPQNPPYDSPRGPGGPTTSLFLRQVSPARVRRIQSRLDPDEQRSGRLYSSQIKEMLVLVEPCFPRQDRPNRLPERLVITAMQKMSFVPPGGACGKLSAGAHRHGFLAVCLIRTGALMAKPAASVQRRLAAIFCADVAGYTRLTNADEQGTLRLLTALRQITDRQIEQWGGRIANTAGDSILAEFPSAVDAVQCALAIQERVSALNEAVPEERRVLFRIGVHVGEVLVKNGDLLGDGVNVTARLEGLAMPGSVCLSAASHEYVHRALPIECEDLGLQAVRNLDAPVRAYLTRPSGPRSSKSIPAVHRRFEFYFARRFHSICMRALAEIAETANLKAVDVPALASIADEPGLDIGQLAERLGIERVAAERSSRRLEARGLIRRLWKRARSGARSLVPTPEGIETRLRLRSAVILAQDRVMAQLSDHEREILKEMLARVVETDAISSGQSESR